MYPVEGDLRQSLRALNDQCLSDNILASRESEEQDPAAYTSVIVVTCVKGIH